MNSILSIAIALFALAFTKTLPEIFVIGDSISIQYGPFLEEYLNGIVKYERKQDDGTSEKNLDVPMGANGGDSRMVLAYLKLKIKDPNFKPDYLLLNCGLHDIKRDPVTNKIEVDEIEYRKNLNSIFQIIKKRSIKILWMQTTPVCDSIHNKKGMVFYRYDKDVRTYNKIAEELCFKNQIPIIDLYQFTDRLDKDKYIDHVHYIEEVRKMQAAYIAGYISGFLSLKR